ncbi:MAG: IS3 family transposase [Lachnospiraceae bacterium]|nr:IS3 family transposase [Lachnospiraceae bacterium]
MYSKEQREKALALYDKCHSVTKVMQLLGYPESRQGLYLWLRQRNAGPKKKAGRKKVNNSPDHPLHPSLETKLDILRRCFIEGENVQLVSEETGYSRASIYTWRRKYQSGGPASLMNPKDDPRGVLNEGIQSSTNEIDSLKQQMLEMQLEIDILKETINVLKKDPGVSKTPLKNKEKAAIVDALKARYTLPTLLSKLDLAKSSYYYQESTLNRIDKYKVLREQIRTAFYDNKACYGYRRIHALLKKNGITVSEKVVRQLMREEGLFPRIKRKQKYSSYKGEISPEVPNLVQRDFHAECPNQKWLTDITEFAIPAGKVYLSPIVDCFDGMLPAWTIGTTPNADLVNDMLDKAIATLSKEEHPLIHSDRGCHYRWPGWIERMSRAGLERSMSKKGCSPDNSACEGLFGRLKNEMFYCRKWEDVSLPEFMKILNDYLVWYNEKRIKVSLGNMSPAEYRQRLGIAA